jgi:hypothetical protein
LAKLEDLGLQRDVDYLCDMDESRPYLKTPNRIKLEVAQKLQLKVRFDEQDIAPTHNFQEHADYELIPDTDPPMVQLDTTRRHGILPRILSGLLSSRAAAKRQMADAAKAGNLVLKAVFNGRQLTLKVRRGFLKLTGT